MLLNWYACEFELNTGGSDNFDDAVEIKLGQSVCTFHQNEVTSHDLV